MHSFSLLFCCRFHSSVAVGDAIHVLDLTARDCCFSAPSSSSSSVDRISLFAQHRLTSSMRISITDECGLLITHPQVLVSPTKVSEASSCIRRPVVADLLKSFGSVAAAAVMGKLRHSFAEVTTIT